jgi:hypothetical protein
VCGNYFSFPVLAAKINYQCYAVDVTIIHQPAVSALPGPEKYFSTGGEKMSVVLVFLFGVIFLAAVLAIRKRLQGGKTARQALVWILFALLYLAAATGFSFCYINASVGHVKATSTAIFLFGGVTVVLAVILARMLGFIGGTTGQATAPAPAKKEG